MDSEDRILNGKMVASCCDSKGSVWLGIQDYVDVMQLNFSAPNNELEAERVRDVVCGDVDAVVWTWMCEDSLFLTCRYKVC